MAEDESDQEAERLVEELEAITVEDLGAIGAGEPRSREYCRRFCEVVAEYTARWQVPLPQLQVLQTALCCFTSASVSFPDECEHVQYVLSRLALSLFELLLFFGKDEFYEAPLKDILGSVQECHDLLIRYDNRDLRLVTSIIKDGGPWEDPVLQATLKGKSEPQDIVDKYLRSESEMFFELRVRYLIACERISEAVALITTCLSHPEVSKNLYYHQAYFTCLYMTRLTDKLLPEHVLRIDCSDGVKIICNIEKEGKTGLASQLCEAFLVTQLQTGNMYCVWDFIFIWSKLQLKVNPSKQVFLERCYDMLRMAVNLKVMFPFMKSIREEIGEAGVQLCVELCGCALQLDLHDNPETKTLIYKTIAFLLPTDLEICRICALSVFFLERTAESYKDVDRLYRYSDEDYNEFSSNVENRVRFELLPILKRGLVFDPEFWNFSMIQTNCSALLNAKSAVDLSSSNTLDRAREESLPLDTSVMQLRNGVLKHAQTSPPFKVSLNVKKNHTGHSPPKMDHNVPRHLCTLCNKEFLGGHIFRHAQTHQKRGCFSCVICTRKFRSKVNMLRHLQHHVKLVQRHPSANSPAHSSDDPFQSLSDTNEANSSEASSLYVENGNSSSSMNEVLSDAHVSCPKSASEQNVSAEHHLTKLNSDLNHSKTSESSLSAALVVSELGESEEGDDKSSGDLAEYVKLNGSMFGKEDPVVKRQVSYLCPAQGCRRVFEKVRALNKHARKAHPTDVRVQQHIMAWNKGKCRFCQRKFSNSRHFIDHLKRHVYPNVYVCQQVNCNKSFKLSAQLVEHQQSHDSYRVQCAFMNCSEVFEQISSLHEHEARHYEQNTVEAADPLSNLEHVRVHPVNSVLQEDAERLIDHQELSAPLKKQTEPVQEEDAVDFSVPMWRARKDVAEPKTYKQTEKKINGDVLIAAQTSRAGSDVTEVNVRQDPAEETMKAEQEPLLLNGYNAQEQTVTEVELSGTAQSTVEMNTQCSHQSDTAQGDLQTSTTRENDPDPPKPSLTVSSSSYGTVGTRPFSRPLPPSYLAEQYLSMPKRRKTEQESSSESHPVSKQTAEKFRCGKCLTNYSSSSALEQHLAQKKCQLYFGFDSDDESAW